MRGLVLVVSLSLASCNDGGVDDPSEQSGGSGGSGETGETATMMTSAADTGSTGELSYPMCEPPADAVGSYMLPFEYADAFQANRDVSSCIVVSTPPDPLTMDCSGDDGTFMAEMTLEGVDAVPLVADQMVVLDEILETSPPQGFGSGGQFLSIRDVATGELLLAGVDSAGIDSGIGEFDPMPWEPELTLTIMGGLCPVEEPVEGDFGDCNLDERVAVVVDDGSESVSVLDGHQAEALGYTIDVATAIDVHEPCIDSAGGFYRVLIVRQG